MRASGGGERRAEGACYGPSIVGLPVIWLAITARALARVMSPRRETLTSLSWDRDARIVPVTEATPPP